MRLKRVSDEVFVADEPVVKLDAQDVDWLRQQLASAPRHRVRICAHQDSADRLHEMLIALGQETYIRPHKHPNKSESFHLVEGLVDILIFDEQGKVLEVVKMGAPSSGRKFYYRLPPGVYHTLLIHAAPVIFHETTNGPFNRADTIFAPWSPAEQETVSGRKFIEQKAREFAR